MRAIHWVRLDKVRPAVLLTREIAVRSGRAVTVAPITTTAYGLLSELPVGPHNGLDHHCVVNCDDITTVPPEHVLGHLGFLGDAEEQALLAVICKAFDFRLPH